MGVLDGQLHAAVGGMGRWWKWSMHTRAVWWAAGKELLEVEVAAVVVCGQGWDVTGGNMVAS